MRVWLGVAMAGLLGVAPAASAEHGARAAPHARPAVVEDPAALLRMAQRALAARRMPEARDLVEQAEARLLTRPDHSAEAERPAVGGTVGDLAAARDAIKRRNASGAATLIASALERLERGEAPHVLALPGLAAPAGFGETGSGVAVPAPASGGGAR